jgi:PAS domain S-box-containing protein
VLDRIVEETRRLLGSDGAHLTLMAEDGPHLVPVVVAGASDDATRDWMRTQEFPLDGGMNGLAASLGETVWTEDYLVEPRIPHEPDDHGVADRLGIRGMAVSPLRAPGGEMIGTLAVSYRQPHVSAADELELLQGLADHAAIAVGNSRLLERVAGSEARYRFMVEHSPDVVFTTDAEGRFTFLSESLERLLGWPTGEVVGSHFGILIDESSMALAAERWAMLVAEPEIELRTRLVLRRRDGGLVPFEVVATGIRHEGAFAGIHGSSRDISDRERLERELRDSETRYRYLVQSSPDAIWQADADGHFTFFSETAEALFGLPIPSLIGRHFGEVVASEDIEHAEAEWARLIDDPTTVLRLRFVLRHADGTKFPTEVSAVPITADGHFAGAHGSIRDLRERERLERERQRLERDLRLQAAELAAGEERAHLARELHDSVTQALFSMTLLTRTIELLLDRDPDQVREKLVSLRDLQR